MMPYIRFGKHLSNQSVDNTLHARYTDTHTMFFISMDVLNIGQRSVFFGVNIFYVDPRHFVI